MFKIARLVKMYLKRLGPWIAVKWYEYVHFGGLIYTLLLLFLAAICVAIAYIMSHFVGVEPEAAWTVAGIGFVIMLFGAWFFGKKRIDKFDNSKTIKRKGKK